MMEMSKMLMISGNVEQMKEVVFINENGEEIKCCVPEEVYNQLYDEYGDDGI